MASSPGFAFRSSALLSKRRLVTGTPICWPIRSGVRVIPSCRLRSSTPKTRPLRTASPTANTAVRRSRQPGVELRADAGPHALAPGPLDQCAPRQPAARLGDSVLPDAGATGMLRLGEPQIGFQLPQIVESLEVPDFGHHRNRDDARIGLLNFPFLHRVSAVRPCSSRLLN